MSVSGLESKIRLCFPFLFPITHSSFPSFHYSAVFLPFSVPNFIHADSSAQGVESPPRLSRPRPHPSSVLFAPDLLMSIFAEPEMVHVFLRHRRPEKYTLFLAHDADERFARCLSLARILPPSLPSSLSGAAATMICREITTKRGGENNNNSNGTLARTHPLPCSR